VLCMVDRDDNQNPKDGWVGMIILSFVSRGPTGRVGHWQIGRSIAKLCIPITIDI
jgi:hypothetical protein